MSRAITAGAVACGLALWWALAVAIWKRLRERLGLQEMLPVGVDPTPRYLLLRRNLRALLAFDVLFWLPICFPAVFLLAIFRPGDALIMAGGCAFFVVPIPSVARALRAERSRLVDHALAPVLSPWIDGQAFWARFFRAKNPQGRGGA